MQWEYKVVLIEELNNLEKTEESGSIQFTKYLNQFGSDGWELFHIDTDGLIFKRQILGVSEDRG